MWGCSTHAYSEKDEVCWCSTAYFKTPGRWLTSSYKSQSLWLQTQRELTLPFSSSAPGHVGKSPAILSRVLGQNPIRFAFPQGPCTVVPQGRAGYVKASSPPLISVLQGCCSWLSVRYTGRRPSATACKILNVCSPVDRIIKSKTGGRSRLSVPCFCAVPLCTYVPP